MSHDIYIICIIWNALKNDLFEMAATQGLVSDGAILETSV